MKIGQATRLVRATIRSLCFAALLSLVATAAGYAAEPVRIGLSLGLTGKYAPLALMQQRAYQLWQRDINAKGGLLGRPVEMVIIDDESKPAKAANLYKQLIEKDRVDLLFGLRIPTIAATDSDASRPPVPTHRGHFVAGSLKAV